MIVSCWNCRSFTFKTRKSLNNNWCFNCRHKYKRTCYIYNIWASILSKRLSRGWTINQALLLEPKKIPNESFAVKDCKYLAEFLEQDEQRSKEAWERAYLKHKTIKLWLG